MDNEHDVHSLVEGNIDHILDRFMSMSYLLQVPWDRQKCLKTTDQTIMLNERVHIWSLDYMQDQFKPSIFKSTGWFGLLAQELIVKCWGEVSSAPNFGGPYILHIQSCMWSVYTDQTELQQGLNVLFVWIFMWSAAEMKWLGDRDRQIVRINLFVLFNSNLPITKCMVAEKGCS